VHQLGKVAGKPGLDGACTASRWPLRPAGKGRGATRSMQGVMCEAPNGR
jgi:hypothetical protein